MKIKNLLAILFLLCTYNTFAQNTTVQDLKTTATTPEIQKELAQPDGVAIFLKEDGSFQIFARGTGTYDIDDIDDINDARQEGQLKAKAALAKFIEEKLSSEDSFEAESQKVKNITSNGKTENANVNKESIKKNSVIIKNNAKELLKGIITLKEIKIPRKNSSGEMQVTVEVSSKTIMAVNKLSNALKGTVEQSKTNTNTQNTNKLEIKKAITDF